MEENKLQVIEAYCELSPISLKFRREVTEQEWQKVFNALSLFDKCIHFWIGDCLAYKKQSWGMYDELVDKTGFDKTTLMHDKVVAQQIEPCRRRQNLSFGHHTDVASLEPDQQDKWLTKASEEKLTIRELREGIRRDKIEYEKNVELPNGIFQVILCDPPWQYGNSMPSYFTEQANYYPLMSIEEICKIPISSIADKNAVLFLWVTSPILEESFEVIKAWGFQYKTSFVWDKIKHNMGHYSSVRHEILLLCIKGSYPIQNKKLYDSVFSEERTEHSKKPMFYYEMIEDLYPHSNKIELFAKSKREGWTSYGNQLSSI